MGQKILLAQSGQFKSSPTTGAGDRISASTSWDLLFCYGWGEWLGDRVSIRCLVLENKEELPEFPPLPLDRGSLGFVELLVLFEFDLRLCPVANPLVRQARSEEHTSELQS